METEDKTNPLKAMEGQSEDDTTGTNDDQAQPNPRESIERELLPLIDNMVRELVKLKVMSRPKGGTKKEQKIKDLIDMCMNEENDEFLHQVCSIIEKNEFSKAAEELKLLARPPPVIEEEEEEMVEETQIDHQEMAEEVQEVIDEGPKGKPYRHVIQDSTGTFVDCLILNRHLLDHLQNNAVLNHDMRTKIACRPNRQDAVRVFLHFMLGLGPQSLHALIDALRVTQQHFLANILAAQAFI